MKICLITGHFPPHIGGVETVFYEYAKRLSDSGNEVRVLTSDSGGIIGEEADGNLRVSYLKSFFIFSHPILPPKKMAGHIHWADIVLTTTLTAPLTALRLCNRYKKPCILMAHELLGKRWFLIEKNPLKALAFFSFEKYIVKRKYAAWIAISKATKNDLIDSGVPKEKVELIYHGIDGSIWNTGIVEGDLHKFLKISQDKKIFVYNGRPGKPKGIFVLLEAIKKIDHRLPDDFLFGFVIGKEPKNERSKFESLVERYGLKNRIKIENAVPQKDVPGYRKDSYAVIVPSLTEGFGFCAAETCALGVPVIASDAGSLPEVVGGKALLFKNGNSSDLAEKIILASQNKFDDIPPKKFDWGRSVKSALKLFEKLSPRKDAKIIICVPTYNRPDQVRSLIKNLSAQEDLDFSLVVLNDGASSNTKELIEKMEAPFDFHYFESEKPSGLPCARNKILDFIESKKLAKTSTFVAFLDDDLIIDSRFVSHIRSYLDKFDGFCFRIIQRGAATTFDFNNQKMIQWLLRPLIGKIFPPLGLFFGGFYIKTDRPKEVDHLNGGCLIYNFTKNSKERFDLNLNEGNFVAEDTCFSYGLKRKGNRLFFIGDYSYIHNPPTTGGCRISDKKESFYWYWKHKLYIFGKYHGKSILFLATLFSLIESAALSVLFRTNLTVKYIKSIKK